MIHEPQVDHRELKTVHLTGELVIVGGGLAGTCAAITAARAGIRVVLIHDRPVLGGNASSEVRLWVLGATSHLGNNNRWAREGGVIDEILLENLFRNREGNPLMMDALLLEKVAAEPNITLLLNTAVYDLDKDGPDRIARVRGFCSQNSTRYEATGRFFCDASGDGIAGFLAGAAFRIGAEGRTEFGEGFAPRQPAHELLGHSLYFYSKDVGRPVKFVPPAFALDRIEKIPRYFDLNAQDFGCRLWWIEWGGRLDTVHDTEKIKWELWKVVYGVWNYIKNSGRFPEAETMTLEWVGTIPGKRESRRFEGDYILNQRDIVEQRVHEDAVSYGGWAVDLHPADGVFSEQPGCTQWHAKGVYQIPYRCLHARNLSNLFLAGRIISASHVAFGSTRVMGTCSHGAQAIAIAAAICVRRGLTPREVGAGAALTELQMQLLRAGQYIPEVALDDADDLTPRAQIRASSTCLLADLPAGADRLPLDTAWAMMLPLGAGPCPSFTFVADVARDTMAEFELGTAERRGNFTPDRTLARSSVAVSAGAGRTICVEFPVTIDEPRYGFVRLAPNPALQLHLSDQRLTGVLALTQDFNKAVGKSRVQSPPPEAGFDTFEYWLPQRRPRGKNLALAISPPLEAFGPGNLCNGINRPTTQPNAWVAGIGEKIGTLILEWPEPVTVSRVVLCFDTDFDHPLESVLMVHPESVMPFCVPHARVFEVDRRLLAEVRDNHHSQRTLTFAEPCRTRQLTIELDAPEGGAPIALFSVRCYA
ncbi:MAG: FAD-dependent oxidoreductase [Opitutaceae bacterium]|nr:FAD-dependent oxidoreductase [Opitutaceae bacterium]